VERAVFDLALALLGKPGQFFLHADLLELLVYAPSYVDGLRSFLTQQGISAHGRTLQAFYLSRVYETLRFGFEKRPIGSYYTPPVLAYAMAGQLLKQPLAQGASPLVYDPCMGTGCLLLPFLDLINGSESFLKRKEVLAHLRGMDLDGQAISMARILMGFAVLEPCEGEAEIARSFEQELTALRRARRFRQGDSLQAKAIPDFDLLVANPPWQTLKGTKGLGAGNVSRLFLERCAAPLLYQSKARRAALLLPSSLLVDKTVSACRGKLLERNVLKQLCLFDNADRAFPAHASLRYSLWVLRSHEVGADIVLQSRPESERFILPSETLRALSGSCGILLLPEHRQQLSLMHKLRDALPFSILLGEAGLFQLGREFDMTMDRACFLAADELSAEARACHLPLLEGRMISRFGLSGQAYMSGRGRSARWQSLLPGAIYGTTGNGDWECLSVERPVVIAPQYYLKPEFTCGFDEIDKLKLCFQSTSGIENRHLMVAAPVPDLPCGNSLTVIEASPTNALPLTSLFCLLAVLNSRVFEFQLRKRLYGNNLSRFLVVDCSLPRTFEQFLSGCLDRSWLVPLLTGAVLQSVEQGLHRFYLRSLVNEGFFSLDDFSHLLQRRAEDPVGFAEQMELAVASLYLLSSEEFETVKGNTGRQAALGNGR